MKELSEDNSTKQDEKIKTEGNEDDEEYQREEPRVDEPESLNLRVPHPKDTDEQPGDDDDEDLLCIDKQEIEVETPMQNKSRAYTNKKGGSPKQTGGTQGMDSNPEEYDEEEYDEEGDDDKESLDQSRSINNDKFEEEDADIKVSSTKSYSKKVQGISSKDIDAKKEILSFIAYPQNLEVACKMLSQSKLIALQEGPIYNKNRIFISGSALMSNKLIVSLPQSIKLCE